MNENNLQNWQETHTIWHRITGAADQQVPDADITVQVYDADLDDIFLAAVDFREDGTPPLWSDVHSDQPLPRPTWWADIVFPADI